EADPVERAVALSAPPAGAAGDDRRSGVEARSAPRDRERAGIDTHRDQAAAAGDVHVPAGAGGPTNAAAGADRGREDRATQLSEVVGAQQVAGSGLADLEHQAA